ncbi:MAG: Hsp20/alpha crystallin family protein [Pseudodesulfovibrio sp.]|jgi:HSP20 family protein|nr:Hsp20/alpha crystallin family protein [Pseudodesulfovibrio sp.]
MPDLKRWSQDEISRMRREMDRLFDDLCADFYLPVSFCRVVGDIDLKEKGDTLVATMELGNMNPDDVNVSVLDRCLIIHAETFSMEGGKRKTKTFRKELKLPCIIRTDDVEANFQDGILEVRLPKCPRQQGQIIKIVKK